MTNIPDHVFRGYDLRGLADTELTEENVEQLGRGYATWLLERNIYDCALGYDCRLSSPKFRDAMITGLTESGITVYDIGMTITQIIYFSAYRFHTKGYVMITASHNPKEYNGFKLGAGYSETMGTKEIVEFRELVKAGKFISRSPKG